MTANLRVVHAEQQEHIARAGFLVHPLGPALGAEIRNIDLRRELTDVQVAAIRGALLRHKVLFFRDQDVTREQHVAFARRFGPLEGHPVTKHVPGIPEMLIIEAFEGEWVNDTTVPIYKTINKWHSDVTFREAPSLGAVLRARQLPAIGGDTIWADAAAAYRDLSDFAKSMIENLVGVHDILKSFGLRVDEKKREELRAKYPPQEHPVVRTHPETGENILNVNAGFTTRIKGFEPDDSEKLLNHLFDQFKVPEHQVRFHWTPNTIAFWDNRSTQHYAVGDYWPHKRVMERVTIAGDKPYH